MGTANATGWEASVPCPKPKVLVVGCGGAGGNSVHRLHRLGVAGARTAVVNTDRGHLDTIEADKKLLIGQGVTRGPGAGSGAVPGRASRPTSRSSPRRAGPS